MSWAYKKFIEERELTYELMGYRRKGTREMWSAKVLAQRQQSAEVKAKEFAAAKAEAAPKTKPRTE